MAYEAQRRVLTNHQALKAKVRDRVMAFVQGKWEGLGSWRDDDIERFIAEVVPLIESGQVQTSRLTIAYMDAMARSLGIDPVPYKGPLSGFRGVPLAEVYGRPARELWWRLSEGQDLLASVGLTSSRMSALVSLDMQMAATRVAGGIVQGDKRIVGFRRVLAPGESCPLCAIASTQRYRKADLMPIHAHCDCSVAPIYGTQDPGQVINAARLESVQKQLADQGFEYTGGKFKTQRSIRVQNHGEYGPVLGWEGQNFTGPNDIP